MKNFGAKKNTQAFNNTVYIDKAWPFTPFTNQGRPKLEDMGMSIMTPNDQEEIMASTQGFSID